MKVSKNMASKKSKTLTMDEKIYYYKAIKFLNPKYLYNL